ncbi:ROK family transcriptional regulator [Falsihalocynthiibacter sp. SS001]|uniref:ROK family transcriptional regulator n=1 Tax=Falsihalocynthiibacter sp. SS001 TaxID=3349698 RepID=UPI0036D29D33
MAIQSKISRRMSQSAIIQAIANYGPISRASVSKMTGLSKQTVSEIVANLEDDGWVRTVGQTEGHIGRRAVVYEISPTAATIASVDLGGTKVRVALCDLTGVVLSEFVEATAAAGGRDVLQQIARMVRSIASSDGNSFADLHVAVIGVPGVLDPSSGGIKLAPNISGIDQLDFADELRTLLDVEVFVENDVNLAALGEHWMGSRGENENLAYISIGTGIGSGLVLGGSLLRGSSGAAGEIGFLPFGADPFEAQSLKVGALERRTATDAIIEGYLARSGKQKSVLEIFDAATAADQDALNTLNDAAIQIARAIVAIVAVIDPTTVVVGGSIGARDELLERIIHHAERCYPRPIEIVKSRLGNHAALAGGAAVALSHLHVSLFAEGQKGAEISVPAPKIEAFKAKMS